MKTLYKVSTRAKKLRITVRPNREVVITYPKSLCQAQAAEFLEKHKDWVAQQLEKLEETHPEINSQYDFGSEFKTKFTTFRIVASETLKPFLRQEQGYLNLYIDKAEDIKSVVWQKVIQAQIELQLQREAQHYLIPRTWEFAKAKQISIEKVAVRKAKTRWGSCSSQNHISLSIYCMTLPDELIDYVIYHELAHVKEKNHSAAFWAHLEELLPDAKVLDKALGQFTTRVV